MLTSYFMLIFAEAIANRMETQYTSHIRNALDACWSFWRIEIKGRGTLSPFR